MQKWDYLSLVMGRLGTQEYTINGVTYKLEKHENTSTILNKLGADGWELIAEPEIGVFTFKRLLERNSN